jgi:glycosyltransferase involved in cell wall biosynthesis
MLALSDRIVAVSNATAAQFPNQKNVIVIHNGFSLEEFRVDRVGLRKTFRYQFNIGATDLVIGCVGRIKWERKGQEYLVQAARLLKNAGVRAKCLIVGSPYKGNESHLERLQTLARDTGLQDEIIFVGEISDPRPAYAAMDIFVLPSAQPEPFAGVVMEAMAMRLPVVATAIGGSLDQVSEGVTGFLVPPADPAALAGKIELLANDPELRRIMGEAAIDRMATHFSLANTSKEIARLYESLIADFRAPE